MWVIQPRSHGGSEVGLVILGADLSLVRMDWILIYTFSLLPVLLPSNLSSFLVFKHAAFSHSPVAAGSALAHIPVQMSSLPYRA